MEVTCVHGDTRTYGTCHVVIQTPQGVFTARAGILQHLPVPLLIGRDCPIAHQKQIVPHREAHQKQIMPHREAHQKQIVPHREAHKKQISSLWDEKLKAVDKERNRELQDLTGKQDRREQTNADALSRRDTCLGGFPYYRGPNQAVEECSLPPLKPWSGRTRGFILDGIYYRHPPAGEGEHLLNPNQGDGRHLSTRTDIWEERERERRKRSCLRARRKRSGPRATRGSRRPQRPQV